MTTERECDHCSKTYTAQRSTARFCSDACRAKNRAAGRAGKPAEKSRGTVTVLPTRESSANKGDSRKERRRESPANTGDSPTSHNEDATRKELEAVDQVDTVLGQAALTLARQLDGHYGRDTGSSTAALVRQLVDTVERAKLAGTPKVKSRAEELRDELARRRELNATRGA